MSFGDYSSIPPEPPPPKKKEMEDYLRLHTQGDKMTGKTMLGMTILNFSRRTTLHGIGHLAHARHNRARLLWFFIMLSASLGFGINLYSIIDKFYQTPILTTTYPDSVVFEFPDITFCNLNPLYVPPQNTSDFNKLMNYIRLYRGANSSLALIDWMYMNGYYYQIPFSSYVINCVFQKTACREEHFEKLYIFPYGFCYTFKPQKTQNGRKMDQHKLSLGHRPFIEILLYKGLYNDADIDFSPHQTNQIPDGSLVIIHEPGTFPIFTESYLADEFTSINILIQQKKRFQLKGNLRNDPEIEDLNLTHASFRMPCIEERPRFNYFFKGANITREYEGTHIHCIQSRVQHIMVKHCKALMKNMPINEELKDYPFLDSIVDKRCLVLAFKEINSPENIEYNNQCRRNPCHSQVFTTVLSQAKYPSVKTLKTHRTWARALMRMENEQRKFYGNKTNIPNLAIKRQQQHNQENWTLERIINESRYDLLNEDFIDRNFMMVKIAPASIFMDKIVETEEYPFSRLLSDIGGCFGLWLGASLVTIFEMFDLCLDMVDVGKWFHRNRIVQEERKYNSIVEERRQEMLRQQKLLGLSWDPEKNGLSASVTQKSLDSSDNKKSLLSNDRNVLMNYNISFIDDQEDGFDLRRTSMNPLRSSANHNI